MPQEIKVDHGRPLGDPTRMIIPPLALWLIGIDVGVIYIRPATPTDNAKVERMQGVTSNWAEPAKCASIEQLQQALDLATEIQRNHYPSRSCGRIARVEAFPKLTQKARLYNPDQFDFTRVYQALRDKSWTRKVSKVGQINLFGIMKSVGAQFKHQQVLIQIDLENKCFCVTDNQQQLIKELPAMQIVQKWIAPLFRNQRTSS